MDQRIISLNGDWRFRPDPRDLGQHFPDQLAYTHRHDARWMGSGYDDDGWETIPVPGHWQDQGVNYHGVAWYRLSFPNPLEHPGERAWLHFAGVDYTADIWLNDRCLGSHEGYFSAFDYDITNLLGGDNLLAVRVVAPIGVPGQEDELWQPKTLFKGALERWDMNDPAVNPGGIWNDVAIKITGAVAIDQVHVQAVPLALPDDPTAMVEAIVNVEVHLNLAADQPAQEYKIRRRITDAGGVVVEDMETVTLLPGSQVIQRGYRLDEAFLWWTWDLGRPHLYTVEVSVEGSDRRAQRFGIRTIKRGEGSSLYLNGIRFYQRGANYLSDQYLSRMTKAGYARDIELIRDANLNTIHPFCVIERQPFYDLCDEAGILIYQDFCVWLMASDSSDFVRRALAQFDEMVEQFGGHPSIAIWNFGSQPSEANLYKLCSALVTAARAKDPGRVISQANATLAFEGNPVHSHGSFFWPRRLVDEARDVFDWRTDLHWYHGWYEGEFFDLAQLPEDYLQLVTEYGAQSLPRRETLERFLEPEALYPPDWDKYALRCAQPYNILPRAGRFNSLEELIDNTQTYQAAFIKFHTEFYRRRKFRPANGAHMFCFNDCWEAISWAVVEYDRTPKQAYDALRRSNQPLQVFLNEDSWTVQVGVEATSALCAINDTSTDYANCHLLVEIARDGALTHSLMYAYDIARLGVMDLAPVEWTPAAVGEYEMTLTLSQGDNTLAVNDYQLQAAAPVAA